ncbi:DUF4326 domain-containing protein [Mesorhizobium sp. M6A.T.Ce.TU.016.01.1.1]|uniref:DUF4326 domain-containing protein n=1 Tax=Mesorhizobium sp. M6A.T.Ce.TU.016.01.1.1 TaxID=2496783 RepID=UPI000FCC06A4|nr:DUF4326 domain-containing protein [Mesorhizobium sp. M6A.T.Ce.TU.016.01.1.1]RUU29706.1 DUF4326 domain-containing protein [Mesorhizobium sp. M6A.T.Ce.TU.016.01.1.1]
MTKPVRLRLSRAKGFDLQAHSRSFNGLDGVNVARPSIFGNPFKASAKHDRAYVVHLFSHMACGYTCLIPDPSPQKQDAARLSLFRSIGSLTGKNLACWCALDGKPCHADVLLNIANDPEQVASRQRFAARCEVVKP